MMWRDEAPREIYPNVGEIWCDFHPGIRLQYPALTWFKIDAIDAERGIIFGHRWPTPEPEGTAARTWIEQHPELGVADIAAIAYFRSWCEL